MTSTPVATCSVGEDAMPTPAMSEPELHDGNDETYTSRERASLSCMQYFDRMYYCYSPAHQARSYYRNGTLDNCRAHMRKLRLCMLSRLKQSSAADALYAEEEARTESKQKAPVWEIRSEYTERVKAAEQGENCNSSNDYATTKWWKIN